MPELIDREATQLLLDIAIKQFSENWLQDKLTKNGLLIAKQIVSKQPTIEAEPVRYGRWQEIGGYEPENQGFACSVCDFATTVKSRFCPNCGADMREVSEDETD